MPSKAEILHQIEQQMLPYRTMLAKAADVILEQDVSNYPIFVVSKSTIEMGLPIHKAITHKDWTIHASTLEEFYQKKLIADSKLEDFKKVYKSPLNYLCLFILSELGATFIFLPRTK